MKLGLILAATLWSRGDAFVAPSTTSPRFALRSSTTTSLWAKPQRLEENVDGVVFVNDRCINCAACSNFAPQTFHRSPTDRYHVVHQQPTTATEIADAQAALAACPVAAIRLESLAERRHRAPPAQKQTVQDNWTPQDQWVMDNMTLKKPAASKKSTGNSKDEDSKTSSSRQATPFPRRFLTDMTDVHWLGHHNDKSFGATPYLLRTTTLPSSDSSDGQESPVTKPVWVMIDTPRFNPSAVRAVESLTGPDGPDYLFLTHVDDTADHGKWAAHYGGLKRIFHAGDLGRHNWIGDLTLEEVEVLLPTHPESSSTPQEQQGLWAYTLDGEPLPANWEQSYTGECVILHTPGHSPGSISLYRRPSPSSEKDTQEEDTEHVTKPGIVFTGDTYGFTTRQGGRMTAFGNYGNNLRQQAQTLQKLVALDWDVVAPGHGHPRDYRQVAKAEERRVEELQTTLEDMTVLRRW